jgi:dihydropteroate synthase/2-amino-4-hydroxy-6-hydroxymethyldihydropteridine diphosphokinase
MNKLNNIYIGLGSNLGDRLKYLEQALSLLSAEIEITSESSIYETPPWGFTDQAPFLNQVIKGTTELTPGNLLDFLKAIENKIGRKETFKYGPREIDIDILFLDNLIIEEDDLVIPHPKFHERAFMLVPFSEIDPDFVHPTQKQKISELMKKQDCSEIEIFISKGKKPMHPTLRIKDQDFIWGSRTYVMGIINMTPDSFSGDGLHTADSSLPFALDQARGFIESGADILDIGGESTRPGSDPVGTQEELDRVIPLIEKLASELDTVISVDTYKHAVADAAISAGANMINDVWGFNADPQMAEIAAKMNVPVILMHNRSNPKTAEIQENLGGRYIGVEYTDLISDIKTELMESVQIALDAGVTIDKIILDPGIGFGKTVEQNLELLNKTDQIRDLGYPVLIGPSRKSFIGYTLDLPQDQRVEGTAAAIAVAIVRGADIVRVHDVEMMVRISKMTDAIARND